jgi:hypothetical protein
MRLALNCSVEGKPARCGWLVMATAIRVLDASVENVVAQDEHRPSSRRFFSPNGLRSL